MSKGMPAWFSRAMGGRIPVRTDGADKAPRLRKDIERVTPVSREFRDEAYSERGDEAHGREARADGGKVKKWMKDAVPASHKGMLHKALHVPQGQKIPAKKLAKAEKSKNPHMRHMAQFAENVKK